MGVVLVVAEKPSVARDIARVVGATRRGDGCLEGGRLGDDDVRVSWCVGHLAQLAPPERYDESWKTWRQDTLPMLPDAFLLEARKEGGDQWNALRKWLCDGALTGVINACDAGREGELIFAYAYELAGCSADVRRLWVSSMTDKALRDGLAKLRPGAKMANLEAAARARSEADWLVGLNATRAMTLHVRAVSGDGPLLSVGRVQTPTLAILVDREREIEAFVAEEFFQVKANLEAQAGSWEALWVASEPATTAAPSAGDADSSADDADVVAGVDDDEEADDADERGATATATARRDRLDSRAQADVVAARLRGKTATVVHCKGKEVRERAPLLYDLTSLQREANRRFRFSATRTLEIAQRLYEVHKVLTYPRTDSRYLTEAVAETLPAALGALRFGPYLAAADVAVAAGPATLGKRFVDDAEVGDHHAIVPTGVDPRQRNLDDDDKKIFDLVARRLLGAFAGDAVFATVHLVAAVGEDRLHARGRSELEQGWRAIDPPRTKGKDRLLPPVKVGDEAKVKKVKVHDGRTRPPPRHSEASVLHAMERAGEQIDDDALARAMKARGLGTPATRAAILETLIARNYAARDGAHLVPTLQGRHLLDVLPVEALRSPRLTGEWEARLVAIAEGREPYARFRDDVRGFVRDLCVSVASAPASDAARALSAAEAANFELLGVCPSCGGEFRARRFGWRCGGCGLRIGDTVAKRKVSAKMAKALLTTGKTDVVKGFRSKAGNEFAAALRFDNEKGVVFDFSDVPRDAPPVPPIPPTAARPPSPVGQPCPLCAKDGGRILAGRTSFGCSRWRQGCAYRLPFPDGIS